MKSATWADLFIALVYAASILLFLAWIANFSLNEAPRELVELSHWAGSWAVAAVGGTVLTATLRRPVSLSMVVFTLSLTVVLSTLAYFFRAPQFIHAEHWDTTEGQLGEMKSAWDVRFDGQSFSCPPNSSVSAGQDLCKAVGWQDIRAFQRYKASNGNVCTFFSHVVGGQLIATYSCSQNAGPYNFSATLASASAAKQ